MFRSIGAVILGYLTFMVLIFALDIALLVLSGVRLADAQNPETMGALTLKFSVAMTIGGFFFAVAAGYVTAWVARRRELVHASALAALYVALGAPYVLERFKAPSHVEPTWYLLGILLIPPVAVPLGGLLRARHVAARGL